MKKSLFLAVFFLVTTMSFANVVKDKLFIAADNEAVVTLQKAVNTFTTEESVDETCYASCYADIYYMGEYIATVRSSAYAVDCVTAQTNCLIQVKAKADKYISEAPLTQ